MDIFDVKEHERLQMHLHTLIWLIALTLFGLGHSDSQSPPIEWSQQEIAAADLARNSIGWSDNKRNTLMHVNLVRMFPVKYWNLEISNWEMPSPWSRQDDTRELASLRSTLLKMTPCKPLSPSKELKTAAECLSEQQARTGFIGHDRPAHCPSFGHGSYSAENCSYGMKSGPDVIAQLLIDEGVPSLGHRINCLNPVYKFLGVSQDSHPKYAVVTVMDFSSSK